jgi:uncharacterized protein YbjT (DUF2867 family)
MDSPEKRPYREVDFRGNQKILDAAQSAGVPRFIYVSAHIEPGYRHTAYIRAHENFVDVLRRSGIGHSVIRPTGIFTALNDLVKLARKGVTPVIGDGGGAERRDHNVDSLHAGDTLAGVLHVYLIGESHKFASVLRRTGESG